MNVLMYTMAMIILLASMTYAKLNSNRSSQLADRQFERFMKDGNKTFLQAQVDKWYDIVINPRNKNNPKTPKTGTSKFSWSILIDKEKREKDPEKLKETIELSKKLIFQIYEEQPIVKKMIEEDAGILDRLFLELMQTIDKNAETDKIKKVADLSSIPLQTPELNLIRYELFKESVKLIKDKDGKDKEVTYSLLDFLTTKNKKTRLSLTPPELLKVIFNGDEHIVHEILIKRQELHLLVKKNKDVTNQDASAQFKAFVEALCPHLNENLFDCTVTTTKPNT